MTLRIGVLGAAGITPRALIAPAAELDDIELSCVAARDRSRAEQFAAQHGIGKVHDSYADVVTDPEIDAVYNPLQISGHREWTLRALEAGKHVLCEKPLALNEAEAQEIADAARATGLVCVEAFHYWYHPVAHRMREIVQSGRLGRVLSAAGHFRSGVDDTRSRSATASSWAAVQRWTSAATRSTCCATSSRPSRRSSRPQPRPCTM